MKNIFRLTIFAAILAGAALFIIKPTASEEAVDATHQFQTDNKESGSSSIDPVMGTSCNTQCGGLDYLACFDPEDGRCCWEGPNSCGDSINCTHFCDRAHDEPSSF